MPKTYRKISTGARDKRFSGGSRGGKVDKSTLFTARAALLSFCLHDSITLPYLQLSSLPHYLFLLFFIPAFQIQFHHKMVSSHGPSGMLGEGERAIVIR
jgi:hypothetical protein